MTAIPGAIRIEDAMGVCGVREDTRLLAEVAARGPLGRALDLGTGSGYVAIYLAQRGWDVDAVDVSPRALALAQHNAEGNGVAFRLYASNLFDAVQGPYDVIAFNPPMRADETESSRLITSMLRRVGVLANMLMRISQPVLGRKRLGFLTQIARGARPHLVRGGRLLLVINPLEQAALPGAVQGLRVQDTRRVESIPGLSVVTFVFERVADESG
jgi:SAM-dependent methyltransferase